MTVALFRMQRSLGHEEQ